MAAPHPQHWTEDLGPTGDMVGLPVCMFWLDIAVGYPVLGYSVLHILAEYSGFHVLVGYSDWIFQLDIPVCTLLPS